MGVKVVTPVSVEPVTLVEAKAHLRVDGTEDDLHIGRCISAAREEAEHLLGRSVAIQTLQLLLDDFPEDEILLPRGPVTTINFVRYIDESGVEQTVSPALYSLDDAQLDAWLLPAVASDWPATREQANAVRIEYVAGWVPGACPSLVKSWILVRVGTLYQFREADAERPAMPQAFVDRLLDPFRLVSV